MSVSSMIDRNGVSVQISIRSDATDTVGGQVQSYANQASTTALVQVKSNSDGSVAAMNSCP